MRWIGFFVCLISFSAAAQVATFPATVSAVLSDPALAKAQIAINVYDPSKGVYLQSHNLNKPLPPASTQKIITTSAAWQTLDLNKGISTYLYLLSDSGNMQNPDDTIFHGHLVLQGNYDPSFGSALTGLEHHFVNVYRQWAYEIRKDGFKTIDGDIIIPMTTDTTLCPYWPAEDIGNYYGATAYRVNFHNNEYRVFFNSNNTVGMPARIKEVFPYDSTYTISSQVKIGSNSSGDNAYIWGRPFTYSRNITGSVPQSTQPFMIRGSLPNPAYTAGYFLKKCLDSAGVTVTGKVVVKFMSAEAYAAYMQQSGMGYRMVHTSSPLKKMIREINTNSNTMFAEAVMRMLCAQASLPNSPNAFAKAYLQKKCDSSGVCVYDGGGLAPENRVTSEQIISCLKTLWQDTAYVNTFSVMGKTGTLYKLGIGTQAQGRVFAKSGTIGGTSSYAGYAKTLSGKTLCFSFNISGYTCTRYYVVKQLEKLMVALVTL